MSESFYKDDKGTRIETWNIEKNGFTFHCRYNWKSDWVEVSCLKFSCSPKGANGKASGPQLIADNLASELIRKNT